MKKVLVILAAVMVLAGCNTVKGFGKDVQKAGSAVEEAASK